MDWDKLKAEYLSGHSSYRKLAEKYDLPLSRVRRIAAKEKWPHLREQCKAKADTKLLELEAGRLASRMARLLSVSDKLLKAVEDAVDAFLSGDITADKSTLKTLSSTLKDLKDIQGIKSELDMEEQRARIDNLRRQNQDDSSDKTIRVVFDSSDDSFCQ